MNRRGLLLLAIVAAALAAYLVYDALRRPGGPEHAAAHARLLPPFERKSVRLITIKRRRGPTFSLRHAPSANAPPPAPGWRIESADAPPADDGAIEDLLAAADLAESDRTADVSPDAAGLQPPEVTVEIETATAVLSAQLGRPDATGQGVYARAGADGPVRVVGRRLLDLADRDASAFRDHRLIAVDPAALTQIHWTSERGEGGLSAVGARWHNWTGEWAANDRVAEALRRLFALRIDSFEPGPAKPAGTRHLAMKAGPTEIDLDIGSGGEVVRGGERPSPHPLDIAAGGEVVGPGERLRVPADALESAWRSLVAATAPDLRLVTQPPDSIAGVELSDGRARVVLARVRGEWTFAAPKVAYAADTRVVDDWLARLGTVKGTKSGGPRARRLVVEGRYQESADVSGPPEAYALLAPDPLRFRDRAVLSFARFDVRRLERASGTDTQQVTSADGGATWRASSRREPNQANVGRVIGALSDLRADEFVAVAPPGAPSLRLEVDVQAPGDDRPTRSTLALWPARDGVCAAELNGATRFRLNAATCAALSAELTGG
ncbi:MAG TPA: DUF4340 domain-containing protein [Polyangia bacterium]|jgi:hypothetical protein